MYTCHQHTTAPNPANHPHASVGNRASRGSLCVCVCVCVCQLSVQYCYFLKVPECSSVETGLLLTLLLCVRARVCVCNKRVWQWVHLCPPVEDRILQAWMGGLVVHRLGRG